MLFLASISALLFVHAEAATVTWNWNAGFSGQSADQELLLDLGDTVNFEWTGSHDVYALVDVAAQQNCDFTDATELGDTSVVSFTPDAEGIYYFGCSVSGHCEAGQYLILTVEASETSATVVELDWLAGFSGSAADQALTVSAGTVVRFVWSGDHNVWSVNDAAYLGACNFDNSDELAVTSPYEYTASTEGAFFFACEVSGHCSAGQILTLTVGEEPVTPTAAPTANVDDAGSKLAASIALLPVMYLAQM